MTTRYKPFWWQLFLSYLVIILLTCVSLALLLYPNLNKHTIKNTSRELRHKAVFLKSSLNVEPFNAEVLEKQLHNLGKDSETRITLISMTGEVYGESHQHLSEMDNHLLRPEVREAAARGKSVTRSSRR